MYSFSALALESYGDLLNATANSIIVDTKRALLRNICVL